MKNAKLFFTILISNLVMVTSAQAAPKFGQMVMTGANSARIIYADRCANGGNINVDDDNNFVQAMLANPQSKISQLRAQLLKEIADNIRGEGVYLGELTQTYSDRDGCGTGSHTFSFFVYTQTDGNTDHTVARYLVNIDDNDETGVRTLQVRSIQPVNIRHK